VNTGATSRNVVAFALRRATGGMRVMVENMTGQYTNITLSAGGHPRSASMLRLTAPSLLAKSGVQIQGAQVGADGSIRPGAPTVIRCSATGKCQLRLPPYTAALVSIA
jgi:hypothetical protein